jgi:formylglycine-generating enzyme required for sulfatase activity
LKTAARIALASWFVTANACQLSGERHDLSKAAASVDAARLKPPAATEPKVGQCPPSMTDAGGVCVDRYEAHLVVPASATEFRAHPHYERPPAGVRFEARSEPGVKPQAYISRVEAARACQNAGKRLCSVREWYRACRGRSDTTYPYGPRYQKGRCNVGRPHLLTRFFGANPKTWSYEAHFNNPKLDQEPGFLLATGERTECKNDFGIHDMVGNLHEWVSDKVDATLADKIPLNPGIRRALPRSAGKGVFMGGFFSTTDEHGRGCNFVTAAHEPAYHDYSTGFRCCRDLGVSEAGSPANGK